MAFVFSCSLTPMLSTHTPLPINARACSDCDDHSLVNSVNWWTATRTGGGTPTADRLLALDLWIIFTSCLVSIQIKLEAILRWDHTRRQTGQGCKILAPYSRPPCSDHAHFRPSFWCQRHICKVLWVCPARLCHADWLKTFLWWFLLQQVSSGPNDTHWLTNWKQHQSSLSRLVRILGVIVVPPRAAAFMAHRKHCCWSDDSR